MLFTPSGVADPCCRQFISLAFPEHLLTMVVQYTFSFNGQSIVISVEPSFDPEVSYDFQLGPCRWKLSYPFGGVTAEEIIDHLNTTCLTPPDWQISGVTDANGCAGTLTFSPYDGVKIPFHNRFWDVLPRAVPLEDKPIPYSPCNCQVAPARLCVSGIRHAGGDFESVEFAWREDMGDRWEYLPPCGDPTTDREVIYIRGDYEGNCWMELDFEQSGLDTNDWADPPNSFDASNPNDIRPGMIQMNECSCGLIVSSETTGGRYVTISSGSCARFEYICETCRCVPRTICVFGSIDGQHIPNTKLTWDEDLLRWTGSVGGYVGGLSVGITKNECGECVGTIDNSTFATPLENSLTPIRCDKFIAFELESVFDVDNPETWNWLWVNSGMCGCVEHRCGICPEERCGGPPRTLYCDIEGQYIIHPTEGNPYGEQGPLCAISVTLNYWERWTNPGAPILECGYIGSTVFVCDTTTYLLTVEVRPNSTVSITRRNLTTGGNPEPAYQVFTLTPSDCDPVYFEIPRPGLGPPTCMWGCVGNITESSVIIME